MRVAKTIEEDLEERILANDQIALERKVAQARRERDVARAALKQVSLENTDLEARLGLIEKLEDLDPTPPKWMSPKRRTKGKAIVCSILSDSHFDEVVRPEEVGGANAYDRNIATLRLEKYFKKLVELARDYLAGVTYDGSVLMLGGDMFSGDIHEELAETNEDTILGSLLYWSELLAAGIDMLADEFGKVHVPVVVGNHGRRSRKPRMKLRARDNFDWFLGHMLAREFKGDSRVTFEIPDGADCSLQVYDTNYLLTHGDQFRGGTGMAGIFSPIGRGDAKKRQRQAAIDQPYDFMVLGHWHQLIWGPGYIVNGSNKGLDEYAFINNFGFEPPQQAMWLVTPEHGPSWHVPVLTQDRKKEGW